MNRLLMLVLYALAGWLLGATAMALGAALTSVESALWSHAGAVSLIFGLVTFAFYSRQGYIDPLLVAFVSVLVVLVLDLLVVACLIRGSFEMFLSPLETWVPLGLIFLSVYFVGLYATRRLPTKLDIFS